MKRRETYATTGPRMVVRFFGGFDFVPEDAHGRQPAFAGYTKGVPMGGDLRTAPAGKSPTFLVAALKDPIGPPVGDTVDVAAATWTNTIGDPELITVWKDPDFDPAVRAFYYARVLEILTPRWTAHDAHYYGPKAEPKVPMKLLRAYTSPIWYTP